MSTWAAAGLWGLAAGAALLLGAAIAYFVELPHRVVAATMGFGAGVLVSVLATDLMEQSFEAGGIVRTLGGFFCGALVFSATNWLLSRQGAKHRTRCGSCVQQPKEADKPGSGSAIALGALLDGIPESIIIGLGARDDGVSVAVVAGFFIANLPQGLSSASGMKQAGRGAPYIFGIWGAIAIASGAAAVAGNLAFKESSAQTHALITSFAAGAVIAMLAETMIPEAFEEAQDFIGLITAAGFMTAFFLFKQLL